MTSRADIANRALSIVGSTNYVQDMYAEKDRSKSAAVCALHFDAALEATMRAFDWPFATRYADLAKVAEQPTSEWAYSYRVPSDCVKARRILTGRRPHADYTRVPWTLGGDEAGRLIYTDEEQPVLEYTVRITDINALDALAAEALAAQLAVKISLPLARVPGVRQDAMDLFMLAISEAEAVAANECQVDERPESAFITSRY